MLPEVMESTIIMEDSIPFSWSSRSRTLIDIVKEEARELPRPVAVFDFDNTMVLRDVGEALMCYMLRKGLLRNPEENMFSLLRPEEAVLVSSLLERNAPESLSETLYAYRKQEEEDTQKAYLMAAAALSGYTPEEARELLATAADHIIGPKADATPLTMLEDDIIEWYETATPFAPIQELVQELQEAGVEVMIVTASSEEAVAHVAQRWFDISPSKVLGIQLDTDEDGRYIPEPGRIITWNEGKVEVIEGYLPEDATILFAAGDSVTDFPMMDQARHKLFIGRDGNEKACRHAERKGYVVQDCDC